MLSIRLFTNAASAGMRAPLALLVALACGQATAQTTDVAVASGATSAAANTGQPGAVAAQTNATPSELFTRTSTVEQGHTELDESFDWGKRLELVREQREAALRNTLFSGEFRTFYMDQDRYDGSEREAWAAGLSLGAKTGYFRDRIAFGGTFYTSQPLYAPDDKGGTKLLEPDQDGYSVLGELYGDIRITDDTHLNIGRKAYDTPYINRNDTRMTPNTFEAIVLQGKVDLDPAKKSSFNYGLGYFDAIKGREEEDFESMSKVAGAKVENGVYAAGANYKRGDFSIGAIDYYCEDVLNISYAEAKGVIPLPLEQRLKLAAQGSYQDNDMVSDTASQVGLKADLPVGQATFTVAATSTGDGADMQSPWGGYPGYTSVQVEDFNRAGEDAVLVRAGYDFSTVKGLSAYALAVFGTEPDASGQYARNEYDTNLQWKAPGGPLKGLTLRLRYAVVTQDGDNGDDLTDLRLMCYYDLANLLEPINPKRL